MDDTMWRSILTGYLDRAHRSVLDAVEGVGEYDLRRPLTPSGTNLLGILKHLATVEHGYLVQLPGRTSEADAMITWNDETSMAVNAEMWVDHSMTSSEVIALYTSVAGASRATLEELPLATAVTVPWWQAESRDTTLGLLAVHVIAETAQHAGHLDILREQLDGRIATGGHEGRDEQWWSGYVAKIAAEAEHFA
ncbi:DinB family protein [uncultured Aeromicrobium sp.]|uniref:DinB family protein n=1 Tax=uncultured Aeromicrobium sp. TaxID=337820 RepID=UPI0025EC88F2|nr:DinB family protein [uncultured Aeromicrobium sp.]